MVEIDRAKAILLALNHESLRVPLHTLQLNGEEASIRFDGLQVNTVRH